MNRLPAEMKAVVAASVEDPATLVNLAMVDKTFYAIIKHDEVRLGSNMCYQRIGHNLMPLALAVAHSETLVKTKRNFYGQAHSLKDITVQEIGAFISDHFPAQAVVNRHIDINFCTKLFSFHSTVDGYAAVIAERALQATPRSNITTLMSSTESEMSRIRKSLYILELLSNLFPRNHASDADVPRLREAAFQPAWEHLLTKFAPWELQQVRCAKQIMARHIQDVMLSDAAAKGAKQLRNDIRVLCEFVSNEGLTALKILEGRGKACGTACAVKQFRTKAQTFAVREAWFAIHDTMWLQNSGLQIDLNATDVINQYPEVDSGPQDSWLHTLLQPHVPEYTFTSAANFSFNCNRHASQWGYAYWDRKRLEAITLGPLPTTEQMVSASDLKIPSGDLCFRAELRNDHECTCG
ncbi:hypothetical protein SLS62_010841 [Diatrype stigma]|uniref:Uncharacterized protein n=1 Tax=Diatrype stigma TaxID=117547 RepID=A0AAN9U9F3_9PEZI